MRQQRPTFKSDPEATSQLFPAADSSNIPAPLSPLAAANQTLSGRRDRSRFCPSTEDMAISNSSSATTTPAGPPDHDSDPPPSQTAAQQPHSQPILSPTPSPRTSGHPQSQPSPPEPAPTPTPSGPPQSQPTLPPPALPSTQPHRSHHRRQLPLSTPTRTTRSQVRILHSRSPSPIRLPKPLKPGQRLRFSLPSFHSDDRAPLSPAELQRPNERKSRWSLPMDSEVRYWDTSWFGKGQYDVRVMREVSERAEGEEEWESESSGSEIDYSGLGEVSWTSREFVEGLRKNGGMGEGEGGGLVEERGMVEEGEKAGGNEEGEGDEETEEAESEGSGVDEEGEELEEHEGDEKEDEALEELDKFEEAERDEEEQQEEENLGEEADERRKRLLRMANMTLAQLRALSRGAEE